MNKMNQDAPDDDNDQGNLWHRDSNYPMDWWAREVENGDTRSNYLDWVLSMYEGDDQQPPAELLEEIERVKNDALPFVPAKYRNRYPEEDWVREVENIDTRLGYESWLVSQLQFDEEWNEEAIRIQRAKEQGDALEESTPTPPLSPPRPRM